MDIACIHSKALKRGAFNSVLLSHLRDPYRQLATDDFVPYLSIIDLMMLNSKEELKKHLNTFVLLSGENELEKLNQHG